MDDLRVAKQVLKDKRLSLVFVKDSQSIFETEMGGVDGFLKAIEKLDNYLLGASVADRIVGKATALLCAYSSMKAVFAVTVSKSGLEALKSYSIPCEFENLVPSILNTERTDKCPFEKLVEDITNPKQAYKSIMQFCRR